MSDKYWLAAQAAGVALAPTAVMALVLSLWRIAAGLHWTSSFVILTGPFSSWEVWLGVAALLKLCELSSIELPNGQFGIDRARVIVRPAPLVNEVFQEAKGEQSSDHATLSNNSSGF